MRPGLGIYGSATVFFLTTENLPSDLSYSTTIQRDLAMHILDGSQQTWWTEPWI